MISILITVILGTPGFVSGPLLRSPPGRCSCRGGPPGAGPQRDDGPSQHHGSALLVPWLSSGLLFRLQAFGFLSSS